MAANPVLAVYRLPQHRSMSLGSEKPSTLAERAFSEPPHKNRTCPIFSLFPILALTQTRDSKHIISDTIDISPSAQIRDIEASFAACNDVFSLSSIRHPNKPHLTAVDSFELFPDTDIWANAYDLFRFSERPGERAVDVGRPVHHLRIN
jgi:hypothetical protein